MQQYRSCLAPLIASLLLLYLVLFGSATHANLRMWWVNHQLFNLAEQTGYTADALLRHEVKDRDFGFLLNSNCDASIYYTTTLSPAEFEERVVQALPETRGQGRSKQLLITSLSVPELRISGVNESETNVLPISEQKVISYSWYSFNNRAAISIDFYDMTNVQVPLAYKRLPITGNIVELYKFGGSFQIWNCPVKLTESPQLPVIP